MTYQYDIAISFAGEDRLVAERIASALSKLKVRVFYDEFEKADLWGKDLYQHFQKIYRDAARYCLIIISKNYAEKDWAGHELKQAQARALSEDGYILPIRIDDTEVPGLNNTTGFIDYNATNEQQIAELILKKLCASLTTWRLYKFLQETNPQVDHMLADRQDKLPILVSSSRAYLIDDLMGEYDLTKYVNIHPTHNTVMNGVGIKGYILDRAGQPWGSYIFELKEEFFLSIKI